jgi:predicted pyridoxine 5'-phosphate oxidase superfamily flavin-nucleotide-binding protein
MWHVGFCRISSSSLELGNAIEMSHPSSDVAFTPSVKAVQEKRGSRGHFARMEEAGGWRTAITPDLAAFLAEARSFYLATASADGQPYVQHRGGPPGFLRVLDERTLGFADFKGNRQYITTGNLAENDKAFIFVMDHSRRRRVKLWGRARVAAEEELFRRLWPEGYQARLEQVIVFAVAAWDTNCPQHIPQMFHAEDVGHTLQQFQARIRELEAQVAVLQAEGRSSP